MLIAAHGHSIRCLVKHLDGISDGEIAELNIPTGIPLVYELDEATGGPNPARDPRQERAAARGRCPRIRPPRALAGTCRPGQRATD